MPVPLLMSAALAIAGEFFPDLVGALRRPGGRALAATVVEAAATAAGVSPSSDPGQIIARVKENPKAADDLRLELEQINTDKEIYLAEIGDRDRARASEIARGADGRMRGNLMIAAVAIGLAFCIYAAIRGMTPGPDGRPTLDAGVLALITTVAGALLKMLSDAFAYEFGSSRGSKDKTDDILAISRTNQQATARAVQSAQTQATAAAARVFHATTNAVTTGAAAATVAAEAVAAKPRDFVGQLVRGEI
ncbi:MAG: hypothetical protein ABTQ27_08115 [Amaricoccus sp.]|uniref:hypothetical protein n=1 Tax=Amaricoccus sp. TaxID=1872485 RepID=UPI003315801C